MAQDATEGRERLRRWVEDRGLTHAQAGELFEADRALVTQWLLGVRRPGLAYALRIERQTGGEVPARSWTIPAPRRRKPAA